MRSAQLRRGSHNIAFCANDFEMIVQVRERYPQASAHIQPCLYINRLGSHRPSELKIIGKHGFRIVKITLLDRIHEGLYELSFIQYVVLYK